MTSIGQVLQEAASCLASSSDTAVLDVHCLLQEVLQQSRAYLYAHAEQPLSAAQLDAFQQLLARRMAGEPIAYLLGRKEFWSLPLKVNPHTLIPRPETEHLVSAALTKLSAGSQVLDLGTGSGAIALALAQQFPQCQVTAIEQSEQALQLARSNGKQLALTDRIRWLQGNWFQPLSPGVDSFDLIVSNPPYLAANEAHWQQGDCRFEPKSALVAGVTGLEALEHIVGQAPDFLRVGGWLLLEHGHQQAEAVQALLQETGFLAIATGCDLAQLPRFTLGQKNG